jgi:predicted Zn-ribbon and HTH transcriptional regulator
MADLSLYTCTSCGFVSTKNFRDSSCPVCRVAMKVDRIDFYFDELDHIDIAPAEHEDP